MTWPEGLGTELRLDGRARDLLTPRSDPPRVLAEDEMHARIGPDRSIVAIEVDPHRTGIEQLVGARAGGGLRSAVGYALSADQEEGSPLYLLLDDVAGSSLIAGFAWSRWSDAWKEMSRPRNTSPPRRQMEGICAGFRPGSSALASDGAMNAQRRHNVALVPTLDDPADPWSWHTLDPNPPVAMRRARRIDLWIEGSAAHFDAMFRDSCWNPDGTEVAVHEYALSGTVDTTSGLIGSIEAEPRVLPFGECPAAAPNAAWLVGTPARELRTTVLERIRGTDCCTHLNDALRALAEVPVLTQVLTLGIDN